MGLNVSNLLQIKRNKRNENKMRRQREVPVSGLSIILNTLRRDNQLSIESYRSLRGQLKNGSDQVENFLIAIMNHAARNNREEWPSQV